MATINRNKTKVMVLCGGLSHERDISLSSGHRVAGFLEDAGWNVQISDMDAECIATLTDPETRPDIVFPLLHGANGEDGSIRSLLELTGVPYVGTRPGAAQVAWNKPAAKKIVNLQGLTTAQSVTLPESLFRELGAKAVMDLIIQSFGLPLFVKPTMGGSALGCSFVHNADIMPHAMMNCFAYGSTAMIEKAIVGKEISVSILEVDGEPIILEPIEIHPVGEIFDYEARYSGPTEYFVPARLDAQTLQTIKEYALTAHCALGLKDISRTDFIVDNDGTPYFLEVNVAPGMTETSLLPQAAIASGYDLSDLYSQLVESVLKQS